jgi:hypothetical protein
MRARTKNGRTAGRKRTVQNCCDRIIADILRDGIEEHRFACQNLIAALAG